MNRVRLFWTFAALAVPSWAAAAPYLMQVYTVEQNGGGLGYAIDEKVTISQSVGPPPGRTVWVAERLRREEWPGARQPVVHQWIDGRKCPALKRVLDGLSLLPPVRIGTPDNVFISAPPTDTPMITLHAPPADRVGQGVWLTRSEYTGPVAKWWSESEKALAGCWSAQSVKIEEDEVRPSPGVDKAF